MSTPIKEKLLISMPNSSNTLINPTLLNADWTLPSLIENTDATANVYTAYSINMGSTAEGQIASNDDHDWYKVELVKDQVYAFAAIGTGSNPLFDPFLNLYDANGNIMASDDDSGPANSSSITYTAQTSGIYYIDASSTSIISGQYGISATLGAKPAFDVPMGAGAIDAFSSWSATMGTGATITYGFRETAANYTAEGSNISTFSQISSTEMSAVETILSLWSDVSGIKFEAVNPGSYTDNATILIGNYNDSTDGAGAFAAYPGSSAVDSIDSDLWLNLGGGVSTDSVPIGSWTFSTIIHELGHALGLSHPGDYNAAPGVAITYDNNAQFLQDSNQYSVMSYFSASATGGSYPVGDTGDVSTPLLFDVYEMQKMYGANLTTRTDNTVYGFGSTAGSVFDFTTNTAPLLCIWDAGGTDTLDCSGYSENETIDLIQGAFSSIGGLINNVSIALNAVIENAVGGSGVNFIMGNNSDNNLMGGINNDTINGGDGNDTISGGEGDDIMDGGAGNDTFYVDASGDIVTEALNAGTDTIITTLNSYSINALTNIENLSYSGSNNATVTGNTLANILTGSTGNDTLNGGAGNDTMIGGAGNDVITGGTGSDTFLFDTALSGITNKDTITDFVSSTDNLQFSHSIFTALTTTGQFVSGDQQFYSSSNGLGYGANAHLIYNTTNGVLSYDGDGNGIEAAVAIAVLGVSHPALVATDIWTV
ncbi:MAG: hypothetical protein RLZZ419_750 [Pseudomonadota bacterium]